MMVVMLTKTSALGTDIGVDHKRGLIRASAGSIGMELQIHTVRKKRCCRHQNHRGDGERGQTCNNTVLYGAIHDGNN